MAKSSASGVWRPKPKNKLGRHTKSPNKHKSAKPYKGQGK